MDTPTSANPLLSAALSGRALRRGSTPSFYESSGFLCFLASLPFKTRAQCAVVCRAWRDAASSSTLWQTLDLSTAGLLSDAVLLGAVRKAAGQLQSQDLTGQHALTCRALVEALAANSTSITELTLDLLDGMLPQPEHLVAIISAAPSLRLVVASLSCELDAVGEVLQREGVYAAVHLEALEVSFPRNIPGRTADAMVALFDMVAAYNETCKLSLELSFNRIFWEGAARLADILRRNITLTGIALCCSYIGDAGAVQLGEGLRDNATLTSLVLQNNDIHHEGAIELAESLQFNATLATLNLSYNCIGPEGATALAHLLLWNVTLTALDLVDNSIGDHGASALAEGLLPNATLLSLDVSRNGISDVSHLAEALCTNVALTNLSLQDNQIDAGGAAALAQMLRRNNVLSSLDLVGNRGSDQGASFLADALAVNHSLSTLHLGSNNVSSAWRALLTARFEGRILL